MLVVDFTALNDTANTIQRTAEETESILTTLNTNVNQVVELWTGAASEGFQRTIANWTQGQQDLRRQLNELLDLVTTAHDNYAQALTTNIAMWRA